MFVPEAVDTDTAGAVCVADGADLAAEIVGPGRRVLAMISYLLRITMNHRPKSEASSWIIIFEGHFTLHRPKAIVAHDLREFVEEPRCSHCQTKIGQPF